MKSIEEKVDSLKLDMSEGEKYGYFCLDVADVLRLCREAARRGYEAGLSDGRLAQRAELGFDDGRTLVGRATALNSILRRKGKK